MLKADVRDAIAFISKAGLIYERFYILQVNLQKTQSGFKYSV